MTCSIQVECWAPSEFDPCSQDDRIGSKDQARLLNQAGDISRVVWVPYLSTNLKDQDVTDHNNSTLKWSQIPKFPKITIKVTKLA